MTAVALAPMAVCSDVPIDRGWLEQQVPGLSDGHAAHYLTYGLAHRLDPTRWFVTDWYAWQNPDWTRDFTAPYLHYLEVGRFEGRDPSPYVDIHQYRRALGDAVAVEAIYDLILRGHHSPALGVTDRKVLRRQQDSFLNAISFVAHRMRAPVHKRPALVVLQAGRGSLAHRWYQDAGREWDLLVNYYDALGFRPGFGDYACFQKGTKFTAMWLLHNRFPDLLESYDHILFLDDDVETSVADLNRLFETCRSHGLDLAQMTLTEDSSCNWAELFCRPGSDGPRSVSAVEIMMPVISQKALNWIAPTFGQSISGFGLDLVWGKLVADAGGRIAVLDDVVAAHRRPVDQSGGAYYSYLRSAGINAKAELWTLLCDYGADRDMVTES